MEEEIGFYFVSIFKVVSKNRMKFPSSLARLFLGS
jgi:hypothetical protein